jgi:probable F420-dependent oxidoreductase
MKYCATLHSDKVDLGEEFVSAAGIARTSQAAEAAGFDAVYATEHPFPNVGWIAGGGHHALDPFVTLAVAAAATTRIRVLTYLCVVPYHNPYVLAKTALTVDVVSGGRLILGASAGYLEPEFAAVGASFEDRNARFDAAIVTMKDAWSGDPVVVPASGVTHVMRPLPVHQPRPPLWLGGNSRGAMRRAVEHGDGWIPIASPATTAARSGSTELHTIEQLRTRIAEMRELEASIGRTLEDVLFAPVGVDVYGTKGFDPLAFRQVIHEYETLGITMAIVTIPATSGSEYCELLASFGSEFIR